MVLSASNTVKPLWQNSKATCPKDDLFAAIDDYSHELYASYQCKIIGTAKP